MSRSRSRWPNAADVASHPHARVLAGGGLSVAAFVEAVTRAVISGADPAATIALGLLAIGTTIPLALLGRLGAACACCAAGVLSLAAFHALTAAGFVAVLASLYWLAHDKQHHGAVQQTAVALSVPWVVLVFTGPPPASSEVAALTVLLSVAAPAASLGGIARRARAEARENQAARRVIADTLVEHMARGERARIAHELHDIVAHHMSMVAVQAESARLTVPGMPPAGAQRLSDIGDTARAALTEMRRLLGVLRSDSELGSNSAGRHPQPGLDELNELIDQARAVSASSVRLILRGAPITLDPGVELVAYRIVQEALTNARRYAPAAATDVELTYTATALRLRIRDNGPGPGPDAATDGHGLAGMRERAAAVGGHLLTGPAWGGGYVVDATLPAKVERTL